MVYYNARENDLAKEYNIFLHVGKERFLDISLGQGRAPSLSTN